MNEIEDCGRVDSDSVPIETAKEINTYELPAFSFEERDEKTQCFNKSNIAHKKSRLLYRTYSFLCVITVFLTLIFSASELLRFVMDDMGAHDMLMKRIFGYGADDVQNEKALVDLIINKTFPDLSLRKNETIPNEPQDDNPITQAPPILPPKNDSSAPTPPEDVGLSTIISMDMSLLSYGRNYIYNDTPLNIDVERFRSAALKKRYDEGSDSPLVLIIHTHTMESYMPEGVTHYKNEGEIARSSDPSKNMIAVGNEFARVLEENGINTIHCTVVHDAESYSNSYKRSAETIAKYLAEYPSIQYVFDLHRDSIMRSSGELVRAVTSIDGDSCAQIMPVVSVGFDGFSENLSFAVKLRDILNQSYANLSRPICVRNSLYNQDLAPVSILLEMGTSGNYLSEVKKSAALVAKAIAELIKPR
jgi:stage II sporulation protein P